MTVNELIAKLINLPPNANIKIPDHNYLGDRDNVDPDTVEYFADENIVIIE